MRWLLLMSNGLNRLVEGLASFGLALICAVFLLEVLFRYVLHTSLVWSLEVNRILFVWVVFLGLTIGWKRGEHIRFDFLRRALPPGLQRSADLFVELVGLGFFLFVLRQGLPLLDLAWTTTFPTLRISQGWLYLAVPVGAAIAAFHGVVRIAVLSFPGPAATAGTGVEIPGGGRT